MPLVTKADGTLEKFNRSKLERSLNRAGASKSEIVSIVKHIESELVDGIKTQEIYNHAFSLLRNSKMPTAARYSLRRALFGLGPTGFPFEDFLARLFEADGYSTRTRIILEGKCVQHELDLAAFKPNHSFVAEAKFHARPGIKSDLHVAMYSYARFLDLQKKKICKDDVCGVEELWLITNTKFTSVAIEYGNCVGIQLLSWNYPKKNNLHDLINKAGIYPVTALSHLSNKQKQIMITRGVILCKDLVEKPQRLRHLHLSKRKFDAVVSEARQLCNTV